MVSGFGAGKGLPWAVGWHLHSEGDAEFGDHIDFCGISFRLAVGSALDRDQCYMLLLWGD
jgi:hypothetical protein